MKPQERPSTQSLNIKKGVIRKQLKRQQNQQGHLQGGGPGGGAQPRPRTGQQHVTGGGGGPSPGAAPAAAARTACAPGWGTPVGRRWGEVRAASREGPAHPPARLPCPLGGEDGGGEEEAGKVGTREHAPRSEPQGPGTRRAGVAGEGRGPGDPARQGEGGQGPRPGQVREKRDTRPAPGRNETRLPARRRRGPPREAPAHRGEAGKAPGQPCTQPTTQEPQTQRPLGPGSGNE